MAEPHIFISKNHPCADRRSTITMEELKPYPYLSFEQGEHNAFYYSEEIFSTVVRQKNIRVRDRATLFNLLIGLNGYTVSSGVIDAGVGMVLIYLRCRASEQGEMHIGCLDAQEVTSEQARDGIP